MKKICYKYNPKLPIVKTNWKGNITINDKFHNDSTPVKSPIRDVLKWKLTANPLKEAKAQDDFKLTHIPLANFDKSKDQIVWLGHASFLISISGKAILTDPCFYNIPTVKRLVALPCKITELQNIDYLLLSHDHRDHFDVRTVKEIIALNPKIEILTTLNFEKLLRKNGINNVTVQEAGWYQQYKTASNLDILFLPAQHWGRRGLLDFNKVLWGGFLIKSNGKTIYFSGDTAYSTVFKEINTAFGDFDICLLPIGAYTPSFIMAQSHTTPEEAYQIFNDLGGKQFVPMHYGTYDLSDEPLGEPIRRLEKCFSANETQLKKIQVGEIFSIK